jgi:hypothetical protein
MTIKFYCTCGKRLSAREESAGRRSMCPRCGRPVGVPPMKPTHPGVPMEPPLTPAQRIETLVQTIRPISPFDSMTRTPSVPQYQAILIETTQGDPVAAVGQVQEVERHERRRRRFRSREPADWPQEHDAVDCLFFPFRTMGILACLSAGLTLATLFILVLVLQDVESSTLGRYVVCLAIALPAIAYTSVFLQKVLYFGSNGETRRICWPGPKSLMPLRSLAAAFGSFLAGPVAFVVVGVWFWIHSGELQFVDDVIFWELSLACLFSWCLGFTTVSLRGRWRGLWPGAVADVAAHLGRTGLKILLAGLVIFGLHAFFAIAVVETILSTPATWFLFFFWWLSILFWLTFTFRWLGLAWRLQTANVQAST